MLAGIVQVLVALAAQAVPEDLGPTGGADAFVPTIADLRTQLPDAPAMTAFLTAYAAEVRINWDALEAAGIISKLEQARSTSSAESHITGVDTSGFLFEKKLEEYLLVDNRDPSNPLKEESRKTITGYKLMRGDIAMNAVADTADHAVDAIMDLRRLNDVLLRVLIARKAAVDLGLPVEQALAMYRVEGNMNVPPSAASLGKKIPSGTKEYPVHTSLNMIPDFGRLIQVYERSKVDPVLAAFGIGIKEFALEVWFVQVGGLDVIGGLGPPLRANFAAESAKNWQLAGLAASSGSTFKHDAELRWDAMLATLSVTSTVTGVGEIWVVNVGDPLALITAILKEALALQMRRARLDSFMSSVPPALSGRTLDPHISYLHYHAGTDNFRALLTRAIVAVRHTTGSRYRPLRTAINGDPALLAEMSKISAMETSPNGVAVAIALGSWPATEVWLGTSSHMDLVFDFLKTFGLDGSWMSWKEHRVNLSRYRVLLSYYHNLMT